LVADGGFLPLLVFPACGAGHEYSHNEVGNSNGAKAAVEILKESYAKGEIDQERFQKMKEDLA